MEYNNNNKIKRCIEYQVELAWLGAKEEQLFGGEKDLLERNESVVGHRNDVVKEVLKERNEESDPTAEIQALCFDKGIKGGDLRDLVGNVDEVVKENIGSIGFRHSHSHEELCVFTVLCSFG